jgi:hypothetical protein
MDVYIQEDGAIKTSQSVKHIYYFRANSYISINVLPFSLVKCLAKVLARTAHMLRQSRAARSCLRKLMYIVRMVFDRVNCGFVNPVLGIVLPVTAFNFVYTQFVLAKYFAGVQIKQKERGGTCYV